MILKMKLKNLLPVFWFFLVTFPVVSPQRCGETGNFIPHDKYDTNRHTLISSLASNASARGGFYNASLGQGSDKVYAVGLCFPGVETKVCSTCLERGYIRLTEVCLNQTEGLVWESRGILCLIRYSNRSFFGLLELKPSYEVHNSADIRYDFPKFDSLWKNLTSRLIARATSSSSKVKYYAAEAVPWTTFQNIYALMQCNPLISLGQCNICLRQCVSDYVSCCHGKQGGIVYRPSCAFRSEIYPFFEAFNLTSAPPPTSLSPSVGQRTNTTKRGGESISVGIIVAIIVPTVVIFLVLLALAFFVCRRMKLKAFNGQGSSIDITSTNPQQFEFKTIEAATDQFSERNVIGKGGFGEVYKAVLNGTEVAIKRLSKASGQGAREFKNEAVLVAKLQHRNLVRLLGFCVDGAEKILVYEFVPNKSLDFFLFDPSKHGQVDWKTRYMIVEGIARGVLYLHQDSRLTVIHRDLKASNILLDADMNTKVADFGMARIMGMDQTQSDTSRIVGTYGYMAPEYAMHGHFSVKSDVYSFGVIVLEIVSGRKNSSFCQSDGNVSSLIAYAWELWRKGSPLEIIDPDIMQSYQRNEVIRCIHIALLCVQKDHANRPGMSTVILMLTSSTITLPVPGEPGFVYKNGNNADSSFLWSVDDASITNLEPR
ncbi:LOW QUALITY PROTEIN: cysteine-rich receptor-like protein kinase 14 [Raphanus sativus]|uniref:LOW QUALITY PROTEIN: cysteine-rich receptor-like protein kinase 14 n=1 Tax=Raphanus sativus TaxID=3726 RepID=A0A6J0KMV6_RAPSA|nr:LOW QUALITY PROTEIN: cysteine-rich receptor-like protein kinase 14 [Raphanus sativus]